MKKLIIAITSVLCATIVRAENEPAATSKEYVDAELANKQPTVPAKGNNVVMTFDSTATDGIGEKAIYDESTAYDTQQKALVTAGTANSAVQMAINGEFICTEYSTIDPTDCWLWGIKSEYYAKYDLIGSRRNSGLFSRNASAGATFDSNTKISTVLIDSGVTRGNVFFGLDNYYGHGGFVNGHKYYWRAKMRTTVPGVVVYISRETVTGVSIPATNEWGVYGVIFQSKFNETGNHHYPALWCEYSGGNQGVMIDQNEYSIFDLTEIFGAGNEPATADDAAKALGLLYMP